MRQQRRVSFFFAKHTKAKKGPRGVPFKFVQKLELLRYYDVLSVREVRVHYGNSVVTCSQAVLHYDTVTSYNVLLSNLLRDYSLTRHVGYFEDDVLTAQVQLTVELNTERAFEDWVREDVPLSRVVDVGQAVAITVVLSEARTVVVSSVSVEVCSISVSATENLSVS